MPKAPRNTGTSETVSEGTGCGFVTERNGAVLIIRFNRPEIRNPLSVSVLNALSVLFDDLGGVSGVVFTGSGEIFASGADLREIAGITPESAREFARRGQTLMNKIVAAAPVTVAAVNGYCFGGALDLALACTIRIASPLAEFSHPGTRLGIITGWGGTQRLPRLIGEGRALEMLFTAGRFGAGDALRFGLVSEIADDPLARAIELAEGPPQHIV